MSLQSQTQLFSSPSRRLWIPIIKAIYWVISVNKRNGSIVLVVHLCIDFFAFNDGLGILLVIMKIFAFVMSIISIAVSISIFKSGTSVSTIITANRDSYCSSLLFLYFLRTITNILKRKSKIDSWTVWLLWSSLVLLLVLPMNLSISNKIIVMMFIWFILNAFILIRFVFNKQE